MLQVSIVTQQSKTAAVKHQMQRHKAPVLLELSFIEIISLRQADSCILHQLRLLVQVVYLCSAARPVLGNGCAAIQTKARADTILDQGDVMPKFFGQFV